jgi:hypothetical protein
MSSRALSTQLRDDLRAYLNWARRTQDMDLNYEIEFLEDLTPMLRSKVAIETNDNFMKTMPFFKVEQKKVRNFLFEIATKISFTF